MISRILETFHSGIFPSLVVFAAIPARFYDHIDESLERLKELDCTPLRLDPDAPVRLTQTNLPERCAFILGHEEFGFSFDAAEYLGIGAVSIPLLGALESLNVSIAASIAMYEWVRQHYDRVD